MLVVGKGGGCLDIYRLSVLFSFSLSLEDGPTQTKILLQEAVTKNEQTDNQPTKETKMIQNLQTFLQPCVLLYPESILAPLQALAAKSSK